MGEGRARWTGRLALSLRPATHEAVTVYGEGTAL